MPPKEKKLSALMGFNQPNQYFKQVPVANKCLAIVMEFVPKNRGERELNSMKNKKSRRGTKLLKSNENFSLKYDGQEIFEGFREENRISYWNPSLVESINMIEYVGFVKPGTMFVSGEEKYLECLKNAWIKCILKAPTDFVIRRLGDVGGIEIQEVPQTQFIPLPEVLCLIVSSLNRIGQPATIAKVAESLRSQYPHMIIPSESILRKTLSSLMTEGKVFCMNNHYFAPSLAMLQQCQKAFFNGRNVAQNIDTSTFGIFVGKDSPTGTTSRRQATCTRECQTGASVTNVIPPYKPKSRKNQAVNVDLKKPQQQTMMEKQVASEEKKDSKKEKQKIPWSSVFTRLFGRSRFRDCKNVAKNQQISTQSNNRPVVSTFSTQFPPLEWMYSQNYANSDLPRPKQSEQDVAKDEDIEIQKHKSRMKSRDRYFEFEPTVHDIRVRFSPRQTRHNKRNHRGGNRPKTYRRHSINYTSSSECINYILNYGTENHMTYYNEARRHGTRARHRNNKQRATYLHTIDDETSVMRTSTPTSGSHSSRNEPIFDQPMKMAQNFCAPPNSDNRDSAISSNSPRVTDISLGDNSSPKNLMQKRRENEGRTLVQKQQTTYDQWPKSMICDNLRDLAKHEHVYVNLADTVAENKVGCESADKDLGAEKEFFSENTAFFEHFYENISRTALLSNFRRSLDGTVFENVTANDTDVACLHKSCNMSRSFNSL